MNYPLILEYIEAIRSAEDNFEELNYLRPVLGADGEPVLSGGGFSVVFKMRDERDGKFYAVKCFTKEQEGRIESYKLIADELEFVSSNYLTPIRYLEKELFVNSSQTSDTEFPVLLMDWVEGKTLDVFIKENINNQYALDILAYQFGKLSAWLLTQPFAHGDLKLDNILIKEDGLLVLVDYDGMYVPAMKGCKAREIGSPGFRHPSRNEDVFDEHIDDFSIASISLSLKAIALNPSLFSEFGGNDKLLFSERDFQDLCNCKCFSSLQSLMWNEDFCTLYGIFMIVWAKNSLSSVSYRLFNIEKTQKEDMEQVVMLYLKGKKYVEEKKYEEAYQIFNGLTAKRYSKGENVDGVGYLCGKVLGENGLAYMYAYGFYVAKDCQKAVSLFRKAANKNFSLSQFNLGICYEQGWGVDKNHNQANLFFKTAAKQNLGLAKSYYSWDIIAGGERYANSSLNKYEVAYNVNRIKELVSKLYL